MSYSTPTTTTSGNFLTSLYGYVVSLTIIVALAVLLALHDVSSATAIPLISVIGGVHTGAAVASST